MASSPFPTLQNTKKRKKKRVMEIQQLTYIFNSIRLISVLNRIPLYKKLNHKLFNDSSLILLLERQNQYSSVFRVGIAFDYIRVSELDIMVHIGHSGSVFSKWRQAAHLCVCVLCYRTQMRMKMRRHGNIV